MGGIHSLRKLNLTPDNSNLTPVVIQDWLNDADKAEALCQKLGFTFSAMAVERIKEFISNNSQISHDELAHMFEELDNRIIDETKSRKFFSIELGKELLFDGRSQFGSSVIEAFPSTLVDIEEAGICMAFERWTASIFHLMRVMEIALNVLGEVLNVIPSTNRNWYYILNKCDAELTKSLQQRCSEWAADDAFFSGATTFLRSVKDAWRNPTMHVEKIYTKEQAEDIWNAVKGFMRHLATKLKE